MHTEHFNRNGGINVNLADGLVGDVQFTVKQYFENDYGSFANVGEHYFDGHRFVTIKIPGDVLIDLVANEVRRVKIAKLEKDSALNLLFGKER